MICRCMYLTHMLLFLYNRLKAGNSQYKVVAKEWIRGISKHGLQGTGIPCTKPNMIPRAWEQRSGEAEMRIMINKSSHIYWKK